MLTEVGACLFQVERLRGDRQFRGTTPSFSFTAAVRTPPSGRLGAQTSRCKCAKVPFLWPPMPCRQGYAAGPEQPARHDAQQAIAAGAAARALARGLAGAVRRKHTHVPAARTRADRRRRRQRRDRAPRGRPAGGHGVRSAAPAARGRRGRGGGRRAGERGRGHHLVGAPVQSVWAAGCKCLQGHMPLCEFYSAGAWPRTQSMKTKSKAAVAWRAIAPQSATRTANVRGCRSWKRSCPFSCSQQPAFFLWSLPLQTPQSGS